MISTQNQIVQMSPSRETLWAEYISEREDCQTIVAEDGFITFKYMNDGIGYIRDFFVRKSQRGLGVGKELWATVLSIFEEKRVTKVIAQIDVRSPTACEVLPMFLSKGFRIVKAHLDVLTIEKEI